MHFPYFLSPTWDLICIYYRICLRFTHGEMIIINQYINVCVLGYIPIPQSFKIIIILLPDCHYLRGDSIPPEEFIFVFNMKVQGCELQNIQVLQYCVVFNIQDRRPTDTHNLRGTRQFLRKIVQDVLCQIIFGYVPSFKLVFRVHQMAEKHRFTQTCT